MVSDWLPPTCLAVLIPVTLAARSAAGRGCRAGVGKRLPGISKPTVNMNRHAPWFSTFLDLANGAKLSAVDERPPPQGD